MTIEVVVAMYLVAALLAGVAVWAVIGGALHVGAKRAEGFQNLLFYLVPLGMAVQSAMSGRNLNATSTMLVESTHPVAGWVSRLISLVLLAISAERIGNWLIARRGTTHAVPGAVMLAFAMYWLTNVGLSAAFGTRPTLAHEYFYTLIIGLGMLLSGPQGGWRSVAAARNALLVFFVASLLYIGIKVDLVMAKNYGGGLIPGFHWRFSGLAPGPNAIGPLAVLMLLCLWAKPYQRRILQVAALAVTAVTLVLSQSKTSGLALAACMACMVAIRHGAQLSSTLADPRQSTNVASALGFALLILAIVAGFAMFGGLDDKVERVLSTRAGGDLMSLTGRNQIWDLAIAEWLRNPAFGYGPKLWSPEYRFSVGLPAAYHAHNQLFNALALAGVVGAVGLVVYVVTLLIQAIRLAKVSGGLIVALLVLIGVRAISEVPLTMLSYGPEVMAHFLVLALVGQEAARRSDATAYRASAIVVNAVSSTRWRS